VKTSHGVRRMGRFLVVAAIALGGIGGASATGAAAQSTADSGQAVGQGIQTVFFQIRVRHTDKCLDLNTAAVDPKADGVPVQQWNCLGPEQKNQLWRLIDNGDGTYTVKSLFSGKCLDASEVGTANGTKVGQWTCTGLSNQRWNFDFVSNDFYYWIRPAYDASNCLDVDTGVANPAGNGVPVQLWDCLPSEPHNQLWRLLSS